MEGRWIKWILWVYLAVAFLFIFAPIISLSVFSFHAGRIQSFPIEEFSTKWYQAAWENRQLREGLRNSFLIGIAVSIAATGLGFLSAHVLCRHRPRYELFYLALIILPVLLPLLLSGMALLMYFQRIQLTGSLWAVMVAHITYASPFAMVLIYDPYQGLNVELEQAARNLGAGRVRTILQIVIPQLWPALISAALLSFLISWGEFVLAWFVSGFSRTLPVVIYGMLSGTFSPVLNAIGTMVIGISVILLVVVFAFQTLAYRTR